ncbi:helix-turn-helix transcriptional regulator [Pseudidiomarina terrestris]|uniref:helix-turn-helix transcriptional regulator n=1 Tax=Pseudidiomarina terrestris TaxID=2820060 RepID=UPI002652DBF4|nr:AlpA family transcriptional regulator [Pseudidiomarina sp. 1ASP75-5]MDN7136380.1 AlpA family transcriptional regulator [Pseudidiomarina sp. 1ASP75-5]
MNKYATKTAYEEHQHKRLLRLRDVMALVKLSKSQIYKLSSDGRFPRAIKLVEGGTTVAWLEEEVLAWIDSRVAARGEKS